MRGTQKQWHDCNRLTAAEFLSHQQRTWDDFIDPLDGLNQCTSFVVTHHWGALELAYFSIRIDTHD